MPQLFSVAFVLQSSSKLIIEIQKKLQLILLYPRTGRMFAQNCIDISLIVVNTTEKDYPQYRFHISVAIKFCNLRYENHFGVLELRLSGSMMNDRYTWIRKNSGFFFYFSEIDMTLTNMFDKLIEDTSQTIQCSTS